MLLKGTLMPNCFAYCYLLNGDHPKQALTLDKINNWQPTDGLLWLHLDYTQPQAQQWIQQSQLPDIEKDSLINDRDRPRLNQTKDGFFLALRGVNIDKNAQGKPSDNMLSIRGYFTKNLIITTSNKPVVAISRIAAHIEGGFGPTSIGNFILSLCDHLASHKMKIIDTLDEQLTELEDQVMTDSDVNLRNNIAVLRRETVKLRHYVTPQRDALAKLITIETPLLSLADRQKIHEVNEKINHALDDLNAIRERANVTQEELMSLQSETLNQRLYFLSLITTVFLPLGFLTGLFGVNLDGIPGAEDHLSFSIFCGLLVGVLILQLALFYRRKWI